MSKQARATALAQKTPEGSPHPNRVFLRTFAGGSLPGSDEHAIDHRDKPFSLRDMQRWPELSIIPPLTQKTIRSTEQGPASNATLLMKPPAGKNASAAKPSFSHDFSQVRVQAAPASTLQTKMAVNQPGDQYEQEAEQVADNVLRMAAPGTVMAPAAPNDDKPEDETLLRKERSSAGVSNAPGIPAIVNEVLSSGDGQPLDITTRSFMEQRFGHDFSRVRIHTSEHASASAHAVNALAYTVGRDVIFEREQYAPETEVGRRLLAHELTHVVQQREAPVLSESPVQAGEQVKVHEQTDGQQVQREDQPAQQEKSWWEEIVEFSESAIWTLVKEFAPELAPILREILDKGILEWLKGKISSVIDTFINTLMEPVHNVQGVAQWLSTHFSELLTWMQEAAAKLAKGDCSAITEASEKIQQVVSGIVTPIVDRVKEVAAKVGNFFTGLWDSFGAPIWDWLKKVGGAVWDKIQQLGSWIWEKTEPIRNKITKAWTWIKDKLGIGEGPEGQNGLLQWVQKKAAEAWEWIKQKIEPIKKPLMIVAGVVGGIVVMLSPAGPFIAAGAAIGGLIAGIRWIRKHLNTPDGVVSNRDILQKVIIPGIINAIHSFTGKLASIAGLITDKLNGVMAGLGQVISAVGGSIISFAVKAVQWIADQFQSLVNWASDKLMALVDWVSRGLKRLLDFLQPVFDVLKQIGEVVFDILKLPGLILGKLWHIIPACIRDPFVNFLIEHILKKIPLLNKILAIPNIWEKIKARAMEIIHKVFKEGDLPGAIILVFKLILDVLKVPVELVTGIFSKAANALDMIMNDPIGFLKNVAGALKLGFVNFFKNIATHLLAGIAGWLFGELLEKGIHRPKDFSLMSIFTFVLEVLGLSLEKIFEKLEKKMPKQVKMIRKAVDTLSKVWDWFSTLLKEGPEGVWKKLQSKLGDLWGMFLDTIIGWVSKHIFGEMAKQLLSFLDPTGIMEIVQGIIDLYRLLNSAVKYLEKILRIVNTILDTLVGIASGNLGPAAKVLEDAMDLGMPVVIGFLAGLVSLDDIGDYLKDMVETIREKVDDAIEWLIDQAIAVGKAVLDALGLGGEKEESKPEGDDKSVALRNQAREKLAEQLKGEHLKPEVEIIIQRVFNELQPLGLKRLELGPQTEEGAFPIIAEASPIEEVMVLYGPESKKGKKIVMGVTLTLKGPEPLLQGMTPQPRGTTPAPLYTTEREQYNPGGVLVPPEPASKEVQLVTWSTGNPVADDNTSHAEHQFAVWFINQDLSVQKRVRKVEILLTESPCFRCVGDLCRVTSKLEELFKKGEITEPVTLTLKYLDVFEGRNWTVEQDIEELKGCDWKIDPSSPKVKMTARDDSSGTKLPLTSTSSEYSRGLSKGR